ncbi:MAG: 7TM diverse intracellular signaling domain-containing protein [Sulfurimonas sp.]|nr:7TM diverse intracellular signaling domain-containing protein [Sulfurimonas sp.]
MLKILLTLVFIAIGASASTFSLNEQFNLLFFGAFGMIIVYNFAYYIVVKDSAYADYLLFHIFVFLIMLFYTGIFNFQVFDFSIQSIPVGMFLFAAMSLLAFTRDFLNVKSIHIKIEKYINHLMVILAVFIAISALPTLNMLIVDIAIAFIALLAFGLLVFSFYLSFFKEVFILVFILLLL